MTYGTLTGLLQTGGGKIDADQEALQGVSGDILRLQKGLSLRSGATVLGVSRLRCETQSILRLGEV